MFSKRIFMKTKYLQRALQWRLSNPILNTYSRLFATNVRVASGQGETIVEQQNMYTPSKAIDIDKGTFVVFDNTFTSAWKTGAPYEIKETVWKNSIGIIVTLIIENGVFVMNFIPTTLFALNMFYRVASFMTRAVNHMELLNWGTKVKVSFKTGGHDIWDIKNIFESFIYTNYSNK